MPLFRFRAAVLAAIAIPLILVVTASPGETHLAQDATVYITKTGKKYHRSSCRTLKSRIPISLAEAKRRGYGACMVCSPPGRTVELSQGRR